MKVLMIGNGGRENAIARKIFNSPLFRNSGGKLYTTKANPGFKNYSETVDINPEDVKSLADFAEKEKIDFTVVGPETALSLGIADEFEKRGLKIFGPSKAAASIESSKIFAKKLMEEYNVPTARYRKFSREEKSDALNYLKECSSPVVIKADGLAAGKGVVIAQNKEECGEILAELTEEKKLKEAGQNFIIEEFLDGEEVSVFAICDGKDFVLLPFAQDHKKISEGETGKNTGGMGAVAPVKKFMTDEMQEKIKNRIIIPVLKAMRDKGREFRGCLYCGLMIVNNEPYVIEFNCRFGDPETQAVLELIKSDFLEMLISSADKKLKDYKPEFFDKHSCCVVLASEGYPDKYETGKEISGLDEVIGNNIVFHSGTKLSEDGKVLTNGGRVLSVVSVSDVSLKDSVNKAYECAERISFDNKYFRRDIGFRQLKIKFKLN